MKKGHEIGYLILNRVAALNQALKVSGGGGGWLPYERGEDARRLA